MTKRQNNGFNLPDFEASQSHEHCSKSKEINIDKRKNLKHYSNIKNVKQPLLDKTSLLEKKQITKGYITSKKKPDLKQNYPNLRGIQEKKSAISLTKCGIQHKKNMDKYKIDWFSKNDKLARHHPKVVLSTLLGRGASACVYLMDTRYETKNSVSKYRGSSNELKKNEETSTLSKVEKNNKLLKYEIK